MGLWITNRFLGSKSIMEIGCTQVPQAATLFSGGWGEEKAPSWHFDITCVIHISLILILKPIEACHIVFFFVDNTSLDLSKGKSTGNNVFFPMTYAGVPVF